MLVLYRRSEKICRTIFIPTSSRGLFLNISPIAKNIGSRRATAESACTKKNQRGSVQWCVPWEPPSKWTAPSKKVSAPPLGCFGTFTIQYPIMFSQRSQLISFNVQSSSNYRTMLSTVLKYFNLNNKISKNTNSRVRAY